MFLCIGAGSEAPYQPWYDGGRHGSLCFIDQSVFCAWFVGKILPRGKTCKNHINSNCSSSIKIYSDQSGGCHGHQFWRKKLSCGVVKLLSEASVKKARRWPSTQLIKATSCVEMLNVTTKAKELSYLSSYQTLTTDKTCLSYQSLNKLVEKWALMSALSCKAVKDAHTTGHNTQHRKLHNSNQTEPPPFLSSAVLSSL